MNKIGNIIFNEPLINHTKVDYINYLTTQESKLNGFDKSLPTLIVGWNSLKVDFIDMFDISKLSILNNKISLNKLYWEFSFNEQKSTHITGVDMFIRNVPIYFFESKYTYIPIDPVQEKLFNENNILNWYKSKTSSIDTDAIYIYKNNITYVLRDNTIYGIDHNQWDFFGMKNASETFINTSHISQPKNIINDQDGDILAKYNKIFSGYNNLKRYLVVLLSK
jgi:hypothetical protein